MHILSAVQATVTAAMKANSNQCATANKCGVHRNFLIDLLRGRVPTVRDGHKLADEDPRYTAVATGLNLDVPEFVALAKKEQQSTRGHRVIRIREATQESATLEFGDFLVVLTINKSGTGLNLEFSQPYRSIR